MYYRIIRNDISNSKLISLTTMIFVAVAAMLVALSAILVVNLSGALDTLMKQAKTPHFMQMHVGNIDTVRLEDFAKQNHNVQDYQVLEFLNIDGSQIILGDRSFANNVQDNGFTIQSKKFDYLLDLDGNIIDALDGELYVPIRYMKENNVKIGDKAAISGKQFTVAGFLRDSQMNSMLSSSKRFLISKNDYEDIKGFGRMEYLIEFRLKDLSTLGAFETAYATAGLEANGPTITYPLFKMINALTDGLMIGIILLVSVLVVAIAFMCIRFTLLAKIELDYREIGVMKAIGLPVSNIKKIYLAKYAAIALAGSVIGFVCSFLFKNILLENIRLYMGESNNSSLASLFGIIGVVLVFCAIIAYVNGVLKRFRKISAVEALHYGTSQEQNMGTKRFSLNSNRLININIFLGIKDVLSRKRLYATMLTVLVISSFIMIVPLNLYNTISSNNFIKYMGIGNYDMRIDIQQTDNISQKTEQILYAINNDRTITKHTVLSTKTFKVKMENGAERNIKIELGNHSIFPIKYSTGRAPALQHEIALSVLNAAELGKKVGDIMTLVIAGKERKFTVSGVYSDITNGGKTAKATFNDHSTNMMWSVISVEFSDKAMLENKMIEYTNHFTYAKVSDINNYVLQTFGSTIDAVGKASRAAIAVALFITVLITLLFMKMLVVKDRYAIAVMKAVGFTNSDITTQYIARSLFILLIGMVVGTLLANTVGSLLAGAMISSFGASSFTFSVNPLAAYLFCPLLMTCSVLIATIISTLSAGKIKISENIKE
ncbi:FtsX-like permease family protein [Lysinibacillus sp. CD3-6]|uniref:ABC transporter permease n=1 Tax=Lysinibacillus sp. CD3-6 TaxID=2892541 RepID=UPI001166A50A|nr:FtsX-like permease family protein [Lysinibacillus sp. CD3-6]UED81772.1 FtsX-like permease family protein [Lysinibacillus sp. CD3-6]